MNRYFKEKVKKPQYKGVITLKNSLTTTCRRRLYSSSSVSSLYSSWRMDLILEKKRDIKVLFFFLFYYVLIKRIY